MTDTTKESTTLRSLAPAAPDDPTGTRTDASSMGGTASALPSRPTLVLCAWNSRKQPRCRRARRA